MKCAHVFLLAALLGQPTFANAQGATRPAGEWVWPAYAAGERQAKTIVVTETYKYTQALFRDQQITADNAPSLLSSTAGPEHTFVARMSAILRPDYKAWLETWEPESWSIAQPKYRQEGKDEQYWLTLWRKNFGDMRIQPVHKIESGQYVLITYRVLNPQGRPISGAFELPVVFKRSGGTWLVTLDLRADPLLQNSPWANGHHQEAATVH